MNYIQMINRFWRFHVEHCLQSSDATLYFFLLHTCNSLGWKNPFGHSDRHLAAVLKVSVNTIRAARDRLNAAGLIEVTIPEKKSKGEKGQTKYYITVSTNDTVQATVSIIDTVADTAVESNNKLKENMNIYTENSELNQADFGSLLRKIKSNYPKVAQLQEQLTFTEFNALRTEYSITNDEIIKLLDNMENYKPLVEKYTSVFLTLRNWYKVKHEKSRHFHKNSSPLFQTTKRKMLNEGPII